MNKKAFIIFALDDQRYALSVISVKTIIRSVQLTYLTEAPDLLLGLLNLGGTFIPVINIREQFGLPQKDIRISDRIIIADVSKYTIAFIADAVEDVVELEQEPLDQSVDIFPGMEKFLAGISRYNEHSVLIYDINTLFPEQTIKHITDELKQIEEPA
ncbi:MAG: chemotaxis protein CheW [Desulfobacteraceae bacterium]|nr:chemotaxis protein CheW [Desulfobacteraceae bacterium]MBC2754118.1 chemotaxis protein CheW [Desulfobacteraceae bacterium]